jgi:hypothetical protein
MGREFKEIINNDNLSMVINNLPELYDNYDNCMIDNLTKIYKNVKTLGYNPVKYKYGSRRKSGRMYPISSVVGLQSLPRIIRNTILVDYVELDIKSAQPTFLYNLMKQHDTKTPKLKYFIINKDKLTKDKPDYKQCVSSLCNSEFITKIYKELKNVPSWMIELKDELTNIIHPKIKDLYKEQYSSIHKTNAIGTLIYNLYCDKEESWRNDILWFLEHRSPKVNTQNIMPNHDGIYIPNKDITDESFTNLQQFLLDRHKIHISKKELNDKLDLSGYEPTDIDCDDDDGDCNNDRDCADAFLEYLTECGHHFVKDGTPEGSVCWWFNGDVGLWYDMSFSSLKDDLKNHMNYCKRLDEKYRKNNAPQNQILSQLPVIIKHYEPIGDMNTFNDFKVMSSKYKLPFLNGIWDFELGELIPYSKDSFFTYKIQFNIDPTFDILNKDKELKEKVDNVLIKGFLSTEAEQKYWLHLLGRGMCGAVDDKLMYCCIGKGNSGKGVWATLLNGILGSYVSTFNSGGLDDSQYKGDLDKAMCWIVAKRHSRMSICSELQDGMTASCELIKKLVSGGDTISGRVLHKSTIEYVPQTTYFLFLNDWFNKITKVDDELKRRLRFIEPPYNYYLPTEYELKKHLPNVRQADPYVKDWISTKKVKEYVLHLILKNYKHSIPVEPPCCKTLFDDYIDDTDLGKLIGEYVSFTLDHKGDYLPVDKVKKHITQNIEQCKNLTGKYIKMELLKLGAKYTNKRYGGTTAASYTGIKLKYANADDNEYSKSDNKYDNDDDL